MKNVSKENYLSIIFKYRDASLQMKPNLIAEKLNVTRAAVTDMLRKLTKEKLVSHSPYQSVQLTPAGEDVAVNIVRRHRIWETFLTQIVGLPWDKVHEEAEKLEHASSDALIDRLEEMCQFPQFDPHGAPIPDKTGMLPLLDDLMPLSALKDNQNGIVMRVDDSDNKLLKYLSDIGISLKQVVHVREVLDFDKSLLVIINNKQINISDKLAENVFVQLN
jgi:DtxR family transcriptional regulator, Mn-dependent transcriptional regulator